MRLWMAVLPAAALLLIVLAAVRLRPQQLLLTPPTPPNPTVELTSTQISIRFPDRFLIADLATFDDEFFAYLITGYLRGAASHPVWLTYERRGKALAYIVRLQPDQNLRSAIPYLAALQSSTRMTGISYRWVRQDILARYQSQSSIFNQAYALPSRASLEALPRAELAAYIRRFIRFKAATDGRIRRGLEPIPNPPERSEAHLLAEDIVTIADFFDLPLDFFLGIGAMENNYMNVKGDIGNAIWKRRPEKDDVILKHRRNAVLVLNESSGIWQITSETLRHAHRLFLEDHRDYTVLPPHLRPNPKLNIRDVPPEILTTYAGLLFRDLLNRFHGDVALAVGAYNGGPGKPNLRYEVGVRLIAQQARRVLEHAAALQGRPAAGMRFLTSTR